MTLLIEDATKALELSPDNVQAYRNRGLAYQSKGDYEHSKDDYDRAIADFYQSDRPESQ